MMSDLFNCYGFFQRYCVIVHQSVCVRVYTKAALWRYSGVLRPPFRGVGMIDPPKQGRGKKNAFGVTTLLFFIKDNQKL